MLERLDDIAHRLHLRGLVPGWLVRAICDRYERTLWRSDPTSQETS